VNLRRGEGEFAAGNVERSCVFGLGGRVGRRCGRIDGVSPVGRGLRERLGIRGGSLASSGKREKKCSGGESEGDYL